jgi:hypothetical protein
MPHRLARAALLSFIVGWPVAAAVSPAEAGRAQDYQYRNKSHKYSCRPPLKFAAGACVARCPGGFQDEGRYCRFRSMRR